MAGGKTKGAASLPVKPNVSLADLSDDLLLQILFFLPSMNDLKCCFLCSKRLNELVHHSPISERLFASLFQHSFGGDGGSKSHWKARYGLQQCAVRASRDPNRTPTFTTMSVLTPKQERQAFIYDNGSVNSNLSIGYFGMKELWDQGPLCVWGDFYGVRLFPSLNSLMRKGRNMKEDQAVTVADDEPIILTVTAHGHAFFLACASGNVHAARATMQQEPKGTYSYDLLDTATAHTNEVTSLSVLASPPRLISASCDGTVWMYPDSITKSSLKGAEQIIRTDEPILYILAAGADSIWTALSSGTSFLWKHNAPHGWTKRQAFYSHTPTQILLYPGFLGAIIGDNGDTIHSVTTHDSQHSTKFRVHRPAETLSRFGNVVIVGGGIMDGGVSVILPTPQMEEHCLALGEQHVLRCHPGKKLHGAIAYSSVVSTLVSPIRQSLITLSRDGTIAEWRFSTSVGFVMAAKRKQADSHRKRPRPPESTSMLCVVDTLSHLMTYGDADTIARTKMRIIQCAFQQQQDPAETFVGLDGTLYKEIGKAFSLYSGMPSCPSCLDPYYCRLIQQHTLGLDKRLHSTQLFLALLHASPAALPDADWFCGKCHVDNCDSVSKCRLCRKPKQVPVMKQPPNTTKVWECEHCKTTNTEFRKRNCVECGKQGGTIMYVPASKERSPKKRAAVEVIRQPPNTVKMWECQHCQHRNQYRKFNCERCTRQVGIIVFIPMEDVQEEEHALVDGDNVMGQQSCTPNNEESILVSVTCSQKEEPELDFRTDH